MNHAIHRVTAVDVTGPYRIHVTFADGTDQSIDLRPVLAGEIYGPLVEPALFNQVTLDPEVGTIVWPNGADFDPATLHDWPQHAAAFQELASRWQQVKA